MIRLFRRSARRAGLAPGTVEHVGERHVDKLRFTVMDYDAQDCMEKELPSVTECLAFREPPRISWLNVDGLHDTSALVTLGEHYGIHSLVLEDVANTQQRPKMEDYQEYFYIVVRMLHFDEAEMRVSAEQISLVLGPSYVISFQERPGDVFDPVRDRIRRGKGRARRMGADYLAYMLLDAVVDSYFVILERIGEQIEVLENQLLESPTSDLLQTIHDLKREMILLRRSVWPLREVVSGLERAESELVGDELGVFLRDVYDHTIQVVDAVESYRDVLSGLQDLYLSSISNRMNEVMKVLTIIATVFIPLSFLAGIFGMNFENMPELGWKWSYPIFWMVILAIGGGMMAYFRRKGWL